MSLDQQAAVASNWMLPLPDALTELLLARTRISTIARGTRIFEIDDAPDGIYRVLSGVVSVQGKDAEGRIGHLLGPGAWFGEGAALTRQPRVVSTVAITEARLACLPLSVLEHAGLEHPELWRGLAGLAASNAAIAVGIARDLMIARPEQRVIAVLRRLGQSLGHDTPIPLSQEQLADMCVLSRGAISRILSRLEAAGKVRRGYRELWWLGH